jgi:hypothetical protein
LTGESFQGIPLSIQSDFNLPYNTAIRAIKDCREGLARFDNNVVVVSSQFEPYDANQLNGSAINE